MRRIRFWLIISIGLICSVGAPHAHGDWSQEWIVSYSPEQDVFWKNGGRTWSEMCCPDWNLRTFTKVEFFIMPGAAAGVTFAAPTSISSFPGVSNNWTSTLPNPDYSLLIDTDSGANIAVLTTFFSGPPTAKFELDMMVWDDNEVVEREEFKWLGYRWQNPFGIRLPNVPGQYDRTPAGAPAPVPPTILLLAPAGLGVFLFRKRFSL